MKVWEALADSKFEGGRRNGFEPSGKGKIVPCRGGRELQARDKQDGSKVPKERFSIIHCTTAIRALCLHWRVNERRLERERR